MSWHVPVIPATWGAEAEESLEPGRWRLQWAEIALLHSSLRDRARSTTKQTKNNEHTSHQLSKLLYHAFLGLEHAKCKRLLYNSIWSKNKPNTCVSFKSYLSTKSKFHLCSHMKERTALIAFSMYTNIHRGFSLKNFVHSVNMIYFLFVVAMVHTAVPYPTKTANHLASSCHSANTYYY